MNISLGDWLKVGLVIFLILLAWYIHALNGKLQKKELEIELWKQTYSVLASKVAEQNAAINKLEEQRKTALKKREAAEKRALKIQGDMMSREEAVKSIPASDGTCEGELNTIRELIRHSPE